MKAFVTGSTGMLGSNLVYLLVSQGYEVKALARSRNKAAKFLPLEVEIVEGDLEDIDAFTAELAGCDVLFHTAAYFREYFGTGDHWSKLEKINIQGTLKLLDAAEKYGVKKVIYTSSAGFIGTKPDGRPGDETNSHDETMMQANLYLRSKAMAEDAVLDWLKTHSLPVTIVSPSAIFAPRDAAPTSSGKVVIDFIEGRVPVIPPGGFNVVDARDVAQGMLNAVERGKSGERYILYNRYYSLEEIFAILSKVTGLPAPKIHLPYPVALAFGYFSELRSRLTGVDAAASATAIRTMAVRREVTSAKAQRELGVKFRPFEETLRDEVRWFIEYGYVKTPVPQKLATAKS